MDYKQFVNSTINRMEQPSFDAVKKALVGEYLSFSIIGEESITREILSEKTCDYFEKFSVTTGGMCADIMNTKQSIPYKETLIYLII